MWKSLLKLFDTPARKQKALEDAEAFIISTGRILAKLSASRVEQLDQHTRFKAHSASIFESYDTIAIHNPLHAITLLMKLEKGLQPDSQSSFWKLADTHIQRSLEKAPSETKDTVYRYILKHAPKGHIADFLMSHADNLTPILLSNQEAGREKLLERFLSHAAPRTSDFMAHFEPQLSSIRTLGLMDRPSLTKMILNVCLPVNGKDQTITLPPYISDMRETHGQDLVNRIFQLYAEGDNNFKKITNCLQTLETMKLHSSSTLKRIKGETLPKEGRSDKEGFCLYLYQLTTDNVQSMTSNSNLPGRVYILATKPRGYGVPENAGIVTAILAHTDLNKITDALETMGYDKKFKEVFGQMTSKFNAPLRLKSNIATALLLNYTPNTTPLALSFGVTSAQTGALTLAPDSLDLRHEKQPPQISRDILPFQHNQP